MRYPSHSPDGGPRKSPTSTGGAILVTLFIVAALVVASYPLLSGAAILGALTASLYRRIRAGGESEELSESVDHQSGQARVASTRDC